MLGSYSHHSTEAQRLTCRRSSEVRQGLLCIHGTLCRYVLALNQGLARLESYGELA